MQHFYANNKQKEGIKKSIIFIIAAKAIKYLEIKFREVKNLYTKNFVSNFTERDKEKAMEKYAMHLDREN